MDFLKDAFEAFDQRIRSPIVGSIGIAFVVMNWKPIWFLFFSEVTVEEKFHFFEANRLYALPILIGLVFGLAMPWIRLGGAWAATVPSRKLRRMQFDQAHDQKTYRLTKDAEVQAAQAKLDEARERRLIDAGKRLEEAEQLLGSGIAEDLIEQRQVVEGVLQREPKDILDWLEPRERATIRALGNTEVSIHPRNLGPEKEQFLSELLAVIPKLNDVRLEVEVADSLGILKSKGLAESDPNYRWTLTSLGYGVFDLLKG